MEHLKRTSIQKGYKIILMLVIILIGIGINPTPVKAAEEKAIRVGYAIVPGFTEIEDGIYKGYAYEYLMEIARYTGWEYEFIEMSLNDLMYKLRDGEIDLGAGMLRNEMSQEIYDFPEENAGYTYTTLCILEDNDEISGSEYETFQGIKVGYYETSKIRLSNFMKFCEDHHIKDVELIPYPYDDRELLVEALKTKEVDAIINGDLLVQNGQKVVAEFGAIPYYFATTKGNKDVLSGLNKALFKIKHNDPDFDEQLYSKYFKTYIDESTYLTAEEEAYINHMAPLKAVYVDDLEPLQDYNPDKKKAEGAFIDIMKLIARRTGLRYELVKASSYKEAYEMIKNKEADILIGTPDDYVKADQYGITLSQVYLRANMAKVYDSNSPKGEGKPIIAVPKGYWFEQFEGEYEIQYYETMKECIDAVRSGKANFTYGNSYTIAHYVSKGYYPNLSIVYEEESTKVSIGLAKPTNLTLLNIINKAISSLSEHDIENTIFFSTLAISKPVTLKQFFLSHIVFCISMIIVFIILIIRIITMKHRRLTKDKLSLLQKSQIDNLTGIYNREAGIEEVTSYLKTKGSSVCSALLIIDIDHFKQVNDHLGHQVGDELLIEFSQILKCIFPIQETVFRLGGDEFVVFMRNLERDSLEIVGDKLQELCKITEKEMKYRVNGQKISLSIGAIITNRIDDFDKLHHEADEMLYEVKRNGGNGFKIKELF